MLIKIASRKSDLAREQAYQVAEALHKQNPDIQVEHLFSESLGDKNLEDPLWKMPEKGVFTEDFYEDLVSGEVDMVVHSWKDLPVEEREKTLIAGTLPRADQRDLLLVKKSAWQNFEEGSEFNVFTSSPRRAYNLSSFLSEVLPKQTKRVCFKDVRGNIPTRIQKLLDSEEVHGLVVAKAAIDRLLHAEREEFFNLRTHLRKQLRQCLWMVLPLCKNPTAAAQGAVAIEVAKDRQDILETVSQISCSQTFELVEKEREILKSHGGGCHQKIGVSLLERDYGAVQILRGETESGEVLNDFKLIREASRRAHSTEEIWPVAMADSQWFKRRQIHVEEYKYENKDLFVARADALPESFLPKPDQVIWTGGIRTWTKLADRGVWVNGSAEALGEKEETRVELLAGRELSWMKLTHDQAPSQSEVLATYKLEALDELPDLAGKRSFYWASGSSFDLALERNPEILKASHACGPGNTYEHLRKVLGPEGKLEIFVSYASWKQTMLKGQS